MTEEQPKLIEFRVLWQQCPRNYHPQRVLYVKAQTWMDAKELARDHIERAYGIVWFAFDNITEAQPVPVGEVLSRQGKE